MGETSENLEQSQLDWYEELQHRVRWLAWSKEDVVDSQMQSINAENWRTWVDLAKRAKDNDSTFKNGNLPEMINAYDRARDKNGELMSKYAELFHELDKDEILKTLRSLLDLAAESNGESIETEANGLRLYLSKSVFVRSSSALLWLLTLVVYIRSTNNLDHLKNRADFAAKFNDLVPKFELPDTPKSLEKTRTPVDSKLTHMSTPRQNASNSEQPKVLLQPISSRKEVPVPVSLILVFSSKCMSDLQAFAAAPHAYQNRGDLLKQYEWVWFGAKEVSSKNRPTVDPNRVNRNHCWLQLNLETPLNPSVKPSSLRLTDWINAIQKNPSFIRSAEVDSESFDLETSDLKEKGFFVK